jgi:hypothetical protein
VALRPLPTFDSLSLASRQPIRQPGMSTIRVGGISAAGKQALMDIPGVVGVGMASDTVVVVYLATGRAGTQLPAKVEGFSIRPEVVGSVRAY